MASTTSSPGARGICTSRKTTSGFKLRMASIASTPSPAVPTTSTFGSCARRSAMCCRASSSSSTISTRSVRSAMGVIRHDDLRDRAAVLGIAQCERCAAAVELFEPRACVAEADAGGRAAHAGAVVAHADDDAVAVAPRDDLDDPRLAVLERVLHDRLEDEMRHERVERVGRDVAHRAQASLKADLHDLDVAVEQLHLLAQRHLARGARVDGAAEELAEARDHLARAGGIALDHRRDRVERVEEEVRIDLHPQRVEPGLGELGLQQRRARGLVAAAQEVLARVAGRDDGEVIEELVDEAKTEKLAEERRARTR